MNANRMRKTDDAKKNNHAWVIAVNMGYGHQRTAYPLRHIAFGGKVINANNYEGIPKKDKNFWQESRAFYEFVSRIKNIPILGSAAFALMDKFQEILTYYPKRDLSRPTFGTRGVFHFIKKGWGRDLIDRLKKNPLPIISTFFIPAFMAEELSYPKHIYCVICDADINRSWVNLNPVQTKITYLVPCNWVYNRLTLYGIRPEHIILTGYPLPQENIGKDQEIVKDDLRHRLVNLDPQKKYQKLYSPLIKGVLGKLPEKSNHPLTVMFSIGGAGAQKELCLAAIKSLAEKIKAKKLRFIIGIGVHEELRAYFQDNVKDLQLDGWLHIVSAMTTDEYFKLFNEALRETDILWTKPSELSFYAGLGIPIIIAPTIGSQEDFNKRWLIHTGAGVPQNNLAYTDQWLFDLLQSGDLAEMAMEGFMEVEKMGAYRIEKIILNK